MYAREREMWCTREEGGWAGDGVSRHDATRLIADEHQQCHKEEPREQRDAVCKLAHWRGSSRRLLGLAREVACLFSAGDLGLRARLLHTHHKRRSRREAADDNEASALPPLDSLVALTDEYARAAQAGEQNFEVVEAAAEWVHPLTPSAGWHLDVLSRERRRADADEPTL